MSVGIVVKGWGTKPNWGIYAGIFLISSALLTLEVTLTRLFSYTVWYHFAYLTISVALLGFGSSGAIVSAFPDVFRRRGHVWIAASVMAAAVLTVGALLFLTRFPLEVNNLTAKPLRFSLALLSYYVVVGAPFVLGGFGIATPFAAYPHLMGRLYFWDLLGAAIGCVSTVMGIELLGVPGLMIAAAGMLLGAVAVLTAGQGRTGWGLLLAGAAIVVVVLSGRLGDQVDIHITSTKGSASYRIGLKREDHYTKWTALNRVDAFGWDHPSKLQHWGRTGLSWAYRGPRPDSGELTYDGSNGSNIYFFHGSFDDYAMLDHHILRTPYLLSDKPDVLVIGVGGGIDMINALKQGARHVTGVELQRETVYLLKDYLRHYIGGLYDRPDVELIAAEGRHFVRKTNRLFDLIQITSVDTFAAQATGAYILAESYLYTVEAEADLVSHLTTDGLLSMNVGDFLYRDSLPPLATRLALNSYRALQRLGVSHPSEHLMVVAAVKPGGLAQSESLLVKKSPFTAAEVETIKSFCAANGFDVLFAPPLQSPGHYPLAVALGTDEVARRELLDAAWFRLDAVYDDDPFFYNVAKWRNFSPKKSATAQFPGSFIGQVVLVLMLAQSVILGAVFIILPLARGVRHEVSARDVAPYVVYFLGLGIGFMFIEISFVQSFVLFLGSPTYALSVTIFALLLFSSIGSYCSSWFTDRADWMLRRLAIVVACLIVAYAWGLTWAFNALLPLELWARIMIAILAQMPLGLALGMFMPLGVARIVRVDLRLVPWAWGINGVGSVIGTTLAVILAMAWGFRVVALCSACLYLVGTAVMLRARVPVARGDECGVEPILESN